MKILRAKYLVLGGGVLGSSLGHFLKDVLLVESLNLAPCPSLASITVRYSQRKKNLLAFDLFKKFYENFKPDGVYEVDFKNFEEKKLYSGYVADHEIYLKWLKKDLIIIYDEMISFDKKKAFLKNHTIDFDYLFLCPGHYNRFYHFYSEKGSILRGYYKEKKGHYPLACYEEGDKKKYFLKNKKLEGVISDEVDSLEIKDFSLEEGENLKVGFRYKEKEGFLIKELEDNVYYINGASKNGYLYSQWMVEEIKKCLREKQKLF